MPIRLGVIGLSAAPTAWATMAHVTPLKSAYLSENYTIVALATSSPETAKAAAKFHGIPLEKAYSNPEDLANDPDVDMVVVSVKVPLHRKLALPALKAGKDMFVEWPLGASLAQAEEMAALAKSKGIKTIVGLQASQGASLQKAKEIIKSGVLGRIISTNFAGFDSTLNRIPERGSYINDPKSGADVITIPVGHSLDAFCFLLGEFTSLSATSAINSPTTSFIDESGNVTRTVPRTYADFIAISGILDSGVAVSFSYAICTPATPSSLLWTISGEKGSLRFEGPNCNTQIKNPTLYQCMEKKENEGKVENNLNTYQAQGSGSWEKVDVGEESGFFGGVAELYKGYVTEGREGIMDFEGAVKRHRMIDAIKRSAKEGKRESYQA